MRRWGWVISLWWLLSSVAPAGAGEVAVRADVDRTRLAAGESLALRVTIQGGDGEVDTSGLSDFKVLPKGTSTSVRIVNQQASREVAHNFVLIPQRPGHLTIPALAVTVGAERFRTEPIIVEVADPVAAETESAREVWVDVSLSDPQPYAGQQITYRFALFQSVRVTEATFEPPEFTGFSAKEIKERGSRRQTIGGREYVVTEVYYVLVPLSSGIHTIEPATLQLGIVRADQRRRRSPFDDFFDDPFLNRSRVEPRVLQSQPLVVAVRSLPPWQGPEPFSGLVGQFEMAAGLENTQLTVGDATTLAISIQGRGNIMDAQAPPLRLPEAFKSYADTPDEQIQLNVDGYQGKRVFRMALVPVQAGEFQLPAVQLTYFDVKQEVYRTIATPLPALSVKPADATPSVSMTISPEPLPTRKKTVAFTGRDILPPKESLDALVTRRPLTWPLFLLWLATPAAAFGVLLMVQQLKRTDTRPTVRMRNRAQKALKAARAQQTSEPSVYLTALYQALTSSIFARVGRTGEALAWKEAEELLRTNGVEPETARQAVELLTLIESNKFSGVRLSRRERDQLLTRTRQMVRRLIP